VGAAVDGADTDDGGDEINRLCLCSARLLGIVSGRTACPGRRYCCAWLLCTLSVCVRVCGVYLCVYVDLQCISGRKHKSCGEREYGGQLQNYPFSFSVGAFWTYTDTHRHAAPQTVLECAIWHHPFVSFLALYRLACVCVCVCFVCVRMCVCLCTRRGASVAPPILQVHAPTMCVCVCVCVCVFDLDMLLPGRHNKSEEKAHEGEF
jgi:hypothetical protein